MLYNPQPEMTTTMEEQEQDYAEQITEFLEEDTITVDERMELDQFLDEDSDLTYEQADAIEDQVRKELKLPPRNWKQEYQDSCMSLIETYKRRVPKEELEKLQATYIDSRRVSQKKAQAIANEVGLKTRSSTGFLWFSLVFLIIAAAGIAFFFFPQQTAEIMQVPKQISRALTDQESTSQDVDTSTPTSTTQNIATSNQAPTIQNVGILTVAAYLDELGYFNGNLRQATLQQVQEALKLFQSDIKVPQTGQLDKFVWDKLQVVRLSPHRQEVLKAAQSN